MSNIRFTVFTKPQPGIMTKKINLVDGQLVKDGSQCWLSCGTAETIKVPFNELPARLDLTEQNQAVSWGICKDERIKIVKQSKEANTPNAVSRTAKHFDFPKGKPAVMMLDNDTGISTTRFIEIIQEVMPQFKGVARVERPSCSSDIYNGGKLLTSTGSGRVYLLVNDGSAIPKIGKILHQRLILAGHGSIQITKNGAMLVRSLVDDCVWQAERLDFAAAPVLGDGLERRAPGAKYFDGAPLVAADVEDLTQAEERRLDAIIGGLKAKAEPKADKAKSKYIDVEAEKLVKATSIQKPDAVSIIRQRTAGNLVAGDVLHFDDLGIVSVADVLDNRARYNLETLADPLEPGYGGGRCKAIFYANDGRPTIHSFAHGSQVYRLGLARNCGQTLEQPEKPQLMLPGVGMTLNNCANTIGRLLAKTGRFYIRNGVLHEVAA
ncbi:MAG: hypothetical protein U9N63_14825 [Pseudomonadota bacterium]|nr:hypothetical protein [Pseudomonadota bacterium]